MDRKLTQHSVAKMVGVNRNFIYEMELNQHSLTIYSLHKAFLFLGHIPKTLKIDTSSLKGQIFIHRIKYGLTYHSIAKKIGLDKSTIAHFEKGRKSKKETIDKIKQYLTNQK